MEKSVGIYLANRGYIILANDYGDLLKRTKAMYSDDYVVFYLEQQKGGLDVN